MAVPETTSYTCLLDGKQVRLLRRILEEKGFTLTPQPFAHFKAQQGKLTVVAYESGKLLVQGKPTREFVEFVVEPQILGAVSLGYEHVLDTRLLEARIGVDESGKGDFFGPLVVAAFYIAGEKAALELKKIGVRDSKTIHSAAQIRSLARAAVAVPGCLAETLVLNPPTYNRLYADIGNLNRLLAWGHARCIENILGRTPAPARVVVDQFADKSLVLRALMTRGRQVEIEQKHRAESDWAVAAASIIARAAFLDAMDRMGQRLGLEFPRGASRAVDEAARRYVDKFGEAKLGDVAKLHFKTADRVRGGSGAAAASGRMEPDFDGFSPDE